MSFVRVPVQCLLFYFDVLEAANIYVYFNSLVSQFTLHENVRRRDKEAETEEEKETEHVLYSRPRQLIRDVRLLHTSDRLCVAYLQARTRTYEHTHTHAYARAINEGNMQIRTQMGKRQSIRIGHTHTHHSC
jgi:hypothetical protein